MRVERFATNPIVRPNLDARMGDNVNGPSLIRVPDWLPQPLGRYYLYFAHHDGRFIRLAFADDLAGPWRIYTPGVLPLADSGFAGHLASPDVHVDEECREIRLYFHGADDPSAPGPRERPGVLPLPAGGGLAGQHTRVALSPDGLHFTARPELLGRPYFRVVRWRRWWLALGMPGVLSRSRDGLTGFAEGPTLFGPNQRHTALLLDGDTLSVFFTNAGDSPERILVSRIALKDDWHAWRASPPELVLEPATDYEGAGLPLEPSHRGLVAGPVRQLRDPCIFREGGHVYLLYAVAGESGIAIAELRAGSGARRDPPPS
ncbi:MAG TPA: hypothetical protein VMU89_22265 [Thermomicrobiaceae bacterium]|nr:hypothetical protein [Thermomicrobiaceae bacterium]